jgi:hypothetical protein
MTDRSSLIDAFLADAGWAGTKRVPLAGDASFRRYERVENKADIAVLMDAPPPGEDVRPFIKITNHLLELGYSAPKIFAQDIEAGFLLLEDLGDGTFTNALATGANEQQLYQSAVDVLIDLHGLALDKAVPENIEHYDEAKLLAEAALLTEWSLPEITDADKNEYRQIWRALIPDIEASGATLVLRDFHADNLMWLPDRDGVARCGLLDYQDAVVGSPAYDLMSLLKDARRDIDPKLASALKESYLAALPDLDHAAFEKAYVLLAAQRHCKVIGIFSRLAKRDGKDDYLIHIPRVWRLLERAVAAPELTALREWLDKTVPENLRA